MIGFTGGIINMVMNFRFHKSGEFIDHMSNFHLLKKECAPWNQIKFGLSFM
jgi:hypothetical protein